jgi:mono/diheme cytochrome c family protein
VSAARCPYWPGRIGALALAVAVFAPAVHAEERHGAPPVPLTKTYRTECAACHVAYPPGLLPATSWKRLTDTLPHHFGTDASLDPATLREIATWLQANAAPSYPGVAPPPEDRITRSRWFVREHREVPAATWKSPAVVSASRCAACHTTADQGVFDEHDVRLPR